MKTKEEILENKFFKPAEWMDWYKPVNDAMQEFADEQSIAFLDWKDKIDFITHPHCFKRVVSGPSISDYDYYIKPTTELLQIFKNENNGKI